MLLVIFIKQDFVIFKKIFTHVLVQTLLFTMMVNAGLRVSLHWNIQWQSNENSIKSAGYEYASKGLIARIQKMDGIIKQSVKEIDEMIGQNLNILNRVGVTGCGRTPRLVQNALKFIIYF